MQQTQCPVTLSTTVRLVLPHRHSALLGHFARLHHRAINVHQVTTVPVDPLKPPNVLWAHTAAPLLNKEPARLQAIVQQVPQRRHPVQLDFTALIPHN